MPTLLAYFGINSSGLNLAIDLLIVFLVILYGSLVYWTFSDARRRILDPVLIACSVVLSLFPFVGTVVYIILRPPEYLEDVRERDLEIQAAEARLAQLEQVLCPHCDARVERDFLRCPSCLRKLRTPCTNCKRPLEPTWAICPYCEADVPNASASKRSRARRERTIADEPAASAPPTRRERAIADEPATGAPPTRRERAIADEPATGAPPTRRERTTASEPVTNASPVRPAAPETQSSPARAARPPAPSSPARASRSEAPSPTRATRPPRPRTDS